MNSIQQIVVNMLTGWGAVIVRTGLALFLVPFLLGHLGKEGYGIVGLMTVLIGLLQMADLGMRQALGRELAEQAARNEEEAFNEFFSTAFFFYLIVGLALAVLCVLLAPMLVGFFRVEPAFRETAIKAVRVYGSISFVIAFLTPILHAVITSRNRFDWINNIQMLVALLGALLLFLALSLTHYGLGAWVVAMLVDQLLGFVMAWWIAKKTCPWIRLNPRLMSVNRLRSMFTVGWQVYVLQWTVFVAEESDPLVITRFHGPSGVALYNTGTRLAAVARTLMLTMASQMYPLATRQHVEKNMEKQQRLLLDGTRHTMLLGGLISALMFVYAEPFCRVWLQQALGDDYHVSAQIVRLWAVTNWLVCTACMQWPILLGMRRLKEMLWINVPTALLNIGLSIYFAGFTSWQVSGVLVGTVIASVLRRGLMIVYGARICCVPVMDYIRQALLCPTAITLVVLVLGYGLRWLIDPGGYVTLLLCGMLLVPVWGALVLRFALKTGEREWVVHRLRLVVSA